MNRGKATIETPDTVHGRLLESVHLSGYTFERACSELDWLLDRDRWKRVGRGYKDLNAFLATLDFAQFKIAIEQRKKLAQRLAALGAGQRATARLVGVKHRTIGRDRGANAPVRGNAASKTEASRNGDGANAPVGWLASDTAAIAQREHARIENKLAREAGRAERAQLVAPAMPAGTYRLIYADPPWQYEHVATESRAIANQYPPMTLDAICALEMPAADDALLFLWAPPPKLAEALRVIDAWGFVFRTSAVWDKEQIGMGYYFRQQHESLLVAARGTPPTPDPECRPASIIRARRGVHSEKPIDVYVVIEAMYPWFTKRDRIELFARGERPGWTAWGNEIQSAGVGVERP
jgi:N6-adenosine-specific RNA methylase IME4